MRLMIDRIDDGPDDAAKYSSVRMVIQPTLCIRRSCGCEPAKEKV